ncbi:hypothetical protein DPMN_023736 [Dreissena polymorpha]|uniref:Uncharacterized protein n=1 Tax=Dreissena polymorpha TaxID=45954 RepID=A0A9D4LL92_DREPO|nr:hypothetical protein DPMN_023736 [Dreissena polymorpha]
MPRPHGGHVFQPTGTIFEVIQDTIGTNVLTKFHDDRTINVASSKMPRSMAAMFFNQLEPFSSSSKISLGKNILTKFHDDLTINIISRVLTRFYFSHIKKMPHPHFHEDRKNNVASRVLTRKNVPVTIFKHVQDIVETNLLTQYHEDWK